MEEPNDVVGSAPSPDTQAVEKPVEETTVQESAPVKEETPVQQASPTPEGVQQEGDEVDERGVPFKNRYMEYKRKYSELEQNLPNIIEQAVRNAIPPQQVTQPQTPQYTKEELIRFKNKTEDADHRAWAEVELEKIRERESREYYERQRKAEREQEQAEREKQQALNVVMQKYPLAFNPDGSWNNNHPLTQRIAQIYNSRPAFKNDGMGLLGAADMAFADYVLQNQPQLARETKKLKQQVKKLEKATLVEGAGQVAPPQASGLAKAKASFAQKKYHSNDDIKNVAMEYLRAKGQL